MVKYIEEIHAQFERRALGNPCVLHERQVRVVDPWAVEETPARSADGSNRSLSEGIGIKVVRDLPLRSCRPRLDSRCRLNELDRMLLICSGPVKFGASQQANAVTKSHVSDVRPESVVKIGNPV